MKKNILFLIVMGTVGTLSASADVDCAIRALSIKAAVSADKSKVLEIVSTDIVSAPGCACEIVKVAIEASNANTEDVAAIVEAAVIAAPEQMRLISQCAVAVAPDALNAVQAVLAKYDPNLGDSGSSSKDAKVAVGDANSPAKEVASAYNPLDFPGSGPVGPTPGGPGGMPIVPNLPPFIVAPPDVSNVNP